MRRVLSKSWCSSLFLLALLQITVGAPETGAFLPDDTKAFGSEVQRVNGMRVITLPHFELDLPPAPGREEFMVVCVSCHSPRYITMQPPFPQRKWEEIVDKMAKVYGTPMDQEQRRKIIAYLVAINGDGPSVNPTGSSPPDDESDSPTGVVIPAEPEPAPSIQVATGAVEHREEVNRGGDLFKQNCAACHGTGGRGDGSVALVLSPKPENLAATRFSLKLLSQVLWNGKRGTAMPSWRSLPQRDLTALAAYVQTLHGPAHPDQASPGTIQNGKELFLQNCAPCHGVLAEGKGIASLNLSPQPANLKLKQPDFDYILHLLNDGIPGTAMPSWKDQLSESNRAALASFVRSLFASTDSGEQ